MPIVLLIAIGAMTLPAGAEMHRDVAVRQLLRSFAASDDTVERVAVAEKLLAHGEAAADRFRQMLTTEIRRSRRAYERRFADAAAEQLAAQRDGLTRHDMLRQRRGVFAVLRKDPLTRLAIAEQIEPVVAQLSRRLLVDPQLVSRRDHELATMQRQLRQLGLWRDRCNQLLHRDDAVPFARELTALQSRLALETLELSEADRRALRANEATAMKLDAREADAVLQLNRLRAVLGRRLLTIDPQLCAAARQHSDDMHEHRFVSHESIDAGKRWPWDRARNHGTSAVSENIASGVRSGAQVTRAWMLSPQHVGNLLRNDVNRVGVGRRGVIWTQMFGR